MRFVISRDEPGAFLPMHVALASGGEALPVFGLRAAVARCVDGALETGWRSRTISDGELVSLMSSGCRGVSAILSDPVAGGGAEGESAVGREGFLGARGRG